MGNGSYVTGRQGKDGYRVVVISQGDDFTQLDTGPGS
jgi:hypothetical protein